MEKYVDENLFEKCYSYPDKPWFLSEASELFKEDYQLESLEELKKKLNLVKNKLNSYRSDKWSTHRQNQEPASWITKNVKSEINAEFVTSAWPKIYECFSKFPESIKDQPLNSLHLCEGPGSFITSLNHYLCTKCCTDKVQWKWLANTLNPYHEGNSSNEIIMDDRFIYRTFENWIFHEDFTGNIINNKNLEHMQQECKKRLGDVHLITADGAIDCSRSPNNQEKMLAPLKHAEIATALAILAKGGSFIIKMYTMFEASSVSMLFLLNCAFEKVRVFKPCTSKQGNSEVYVICIDYQKEDVKHLTEILGQMKLHIRDSPLKPLFAKNSIPSEFLTEHVECCRQFKEYQEEAIELNIKTFEAETDKKDTDKQETDNKEKEMCEEFRRRYSIKKIDKKLRISRSFSYSTNNYKIYKGSYNDRENFKKTSDQEKILEFEKRLKDLKIENIYNSEEKLNKEIEKGKTVVSLRIYRGQGVTHLKSSSFADVNLLVMRLELNELFKDKLTTDSLWFQQPRVEFINKNSSVSINYNNNHFTSSNENFSQREQTFFKDLISKILKEKPKKIKFINMPFLTHYAVSILCYLYNLAYSEITFGFKRVYEINVTLINFLKRLENLQSELFSIPDQDILCCVSIEFLHHNPFYKLLYDFNNLLLEQNFQNLIKSFSKP